MEAKVVQNAASNPTIPCRTLLGHLSNKLQTESITAATSISRSIALKMKIYRKHIVNLDIFYLWKFCNFRYFVT